VTTGERRRTQEERRAETQGLLLQATISCLTELGYAHTTTQEVLARAGVSKGALTHHYASKADLVLAAMEALYEDIGAQLRADAARLPTGPERVRPAVQLLWRTLGGPMFPAAMELWTAARTDPALREALAPHERTLARQLRAVMRDLLGDATVDHPRFDHVYRLLLTSIRGQALARLLRLGPTPAAAEDPLIEHWVRLVSELS
jgi:AcrR family transcriptional regulator